MTEVVAAAEAAAARVLAADIVCVAGLDNADSKAGVTEGLVVLEGCSACAVDTSLRRTTRRWRRWRRPRSVPVGHPGAMSCVAEDRPVSPRPPASLGVQRGDGWPGEG